jgi:hypothetical protein
VDIGGLAHERGVRSFRERELEPVAVREELGGRFDSGANQRLGVLEPEDPDLDVAEVELGGGEGSSQRLQ